MTAAPKESIAEPGGPRFTRGDRSQSVRVPDYMHAWWTELGTNSVEANSTHVIWRIRGPHGATRFRAAVRSAVARHDVLTSRVVQRDGAFHLERTMAWEMTERSVTDATDLDQSAQLHRLIASLVWAPFAQDATVFRPFVILVSADDAVCGFVLHHRVTDYYGCQILGGQIREHIIGNSGYTGGHEDVLQYSDYLRGMSAWVASTEADHRLEYWRESMRDAPETCLPPNTAAALVGSLHYPLRYVGFNLSPRLRTMLASAARSCRSTLALILMAANHIALSAALQQSDVVSNVIVAGRDTPALLGMAGYAGDCFPVRTSVTPEAPFRSFVQQLQDTFARACRNRVKWERVEQAMREVRGSAIMPVFNYVTNMEGPLVSATVGNGEPAISLEPIQADMPPRLGLACINLSHAFGMVDTGRLVYGYVRYMEVRHDRRTMVAFAKRFLRCATAIAHDPLVQVGSIMES